MRPDRRRTARACPNIPNRDKRAASRARFRRSAGSNAGIAGTRRFPRLKRLAFQAGCYNSLMNTPLNLDGRKALVTGGASGIGEATCRALAGAGASVLIVDVDRPRAEQLARELPGSSVLIFDITDEAAVAEGVAKVPTLD